MDAKTIRIQRKILGLTQGELAQKLGIATRTLQNYEGGDKIPKSKEFLISSVLESELQKQEVDTKIGSKEIKKNFSGNSIQTFYVKLVSEQLDEIANKVAEVLKQDFLVNENFNEDRKINELKEKYFAQSSMTIYEICKVRALGKISRPQLMKLCKDGTFTKNREWFKDEKGVMRMPTEVVKRNLNKFG